MSELLPCPFCGSEAQVARTAAGYWAAYCEKPMCGRVGNFKTEAEAVNAWNTRAERTTTRNTKRTVYGNPRPVCEVCGYGIGDKRWHYCPNCGAKVVSE